jgi:predicted RNA-binding Zn-ribbon protein involved in translation (DUF1610 family)
MNDIEEGSSVTCGICKKATAVRMITDRAGTMSYDLICWHRNARCPKCGELVRDASGDIHEVHPHCDNCDGPYFDDDDE